MCSQHDLLHHGALFANSQTVAFVILLLRVLAISPFVVAVYALARGASTASVSPSLSLSLSVRARVWGSIPDWRCIIAHMVHLWARVFVCVVHCHDYFIRVCVIMPCMCQSCLIVCRFATPGAGSALPPRFGPMTM